MSELIDWFLQVLGLEEAPESEPNVGPEIIHGG